MSNRSDTFNRTGATLGTPSDGLSAWNDLTNSFATAVDGGTGEFVAYEDSGASNNVALLDAAATNVEVLGEVIRIDDQAGVVARCSDTDNFYMWHSTSAGTTQLYKRVATVYTLLATGTLTYTPAVGNTLALNINGSSLIGKVNGSTSANTTDSSFSSGNNHGIRTNTAFNYFNSFSITDLAGKGLVSCPRRKSKNKSLLRM